MRNVFIYKKPDTFQKARQFPLRFNIQKSIHLTLRDFHEIFEVGIYIQKAWHFAVGDVFIYKRLDTSQKGRQFAISFYIQKSGTFALHNFSLNFWNLRRGGRFIYSKNNVLCMTFFILKKQCTLRYVAEEQRSWHYALHFNIQKTKHFSLCSIYGIYRVVLIPNYKRTYDQSDQIEK